MYSSMKHNYAYSFRALYLPYNSDYKYIKPLNTNYINTKLQLKIPYL